MQIDKYLDLVKERSHHAGGGSVAALNGCLATSLILKAYNMISKEKKEKYGLDSFDKIIIKKENRLKELIFLDGENFGKVLEVMKLPKDTEEEKIKRNSLIEEKIKISIKSLIEIIDISNSLYEDIFNIIEVCNSMIKTELITATNQINAAINSSTTNLEINLNYIKDDDFKREINKFMSDNFIKLDNNISKFNTSI